MTTPRIEVDLNKIRHNTRHLIERLKPLGISVTGVTKGVCGHVAIAQAMVDGGVTGLADARIDNVVRLRSAGFTRPITLIRPPLPSQADQTVRYCNASYNTEMATIARLAKVAIKAKTIHGIILMVEMGDMRDGVLPGDVEAMAQRVTQMPGVELRGIGANHACLSGKVPDAAQVSALSTLANHVEGACGPYLETVSGGNSANLQWAFATQSTGRINDLRLGEAILLGRDPTTGARIDGLYTDAFQMVGEVIEVKPKSQSTQLIFTNPALSALRLVTQTPPHFRAIVALGLQDTDITGLTLPSDIKSLGATSDHLVLQSSARALQVGSEIEFQMNYSALMRAMNAMGVAKVILGKRPQPKTPPAKGGGPRLELV